MASYFLQRQKELMVQKHLIDRGIDDKRIINAFLQVPREEFVPKKFQSLAYEDYPISIGFGQTISQPFIVAYMCQLLNLRGTEKILDIGAGSGYQAAILAYLAKEVYSLEKINELSDLATNNLKKLNLSNAFVFHRDGNLGLPALSPFDRIKCAAAIDVLPEAWQHQLSQNGIIVTPLKIKEQQYLYRFKKTGDGIKAENFGRVNFVPFIVD